MYLLCRTKRYGFNWAYQLIAMTLALGSQSLVAQETALEEIVVTARGVEESVRDIPVAITVLSEERLNNLSLTTFEDLAATTPGLDLVRSVSGSGAVINMRGIASNGNLSLIHI